MLWDDWALTIKLELESLWVCIFSSSPIPNQTLTLISVYIKMELEHKNNLHIIFIDKKNTNLLSLVQKLRHAHSCEGDYWG